MVECVNVCGGTDGKWWNVLKCVEELTGNGRMCQLVAVCMCGVVRVCMYVYVCTCVYLYM